MPSAVMPQEKFEYSLVLGGPLFRAWRVSHLSGPSLEQTRRRVLVITALAWLPPVILSTLQGHAFAGEVLAYLRGLESQVRLLIALPVLIYAERFIHSRTASVIQFFEERRLVATQDAPVLSAAIEDAVQMRNSLWPEVILLVFVYVVAATTWQSDVTRAGGGWYTLPRAGSVHLSPAGLWYSFVSFPIYRFILLRWYLRLGIWFWLLWRISRLNLNLLPTHPDGVGGLGFLGRSSRAFAPVLFAQGALLAGLIANRIFFQGENLLSFKLIIGGVLAFFVSAIIGPLLMFTPQLNRAKRAGLRAYGTMASNYVELFDVKWIHGGAKDEPILGTSDIQSLADLRNAYGDLSKMRLVPFTTLDAGWLAVATGLPVAPLLLTIMPLERLLTYLFSVIF
jgi:hypothetical protein